MERKAVPHQPEQQPKPSAAWQPARPPTPRPPPPHFFKETPHAVKCCYPEELVAFCRAVCFALVLCFALLFLICMGLWLNHWMPAKGDADCDACGAIDDATTNTVTFRGPKRGWIPIMEPVQGGLCVRRHCPSSSRALEVAASNGMALRLDPGTLPQAAEEAAVADCTGAQLFTVVAAPAIAPNNSAIIPKLSIRRNGTVVAHVTGTHISDAEMELFEAGTWVRLASAKRTQMASAASQEWRVASWRRTPALPRSPELLALLVGARAFAEASPSDTCNWFMDSSTQIVLVLLLVVLFLAGCSKFLTSHRVHGVQDRNAAEGIDATDVACSQTGSAPWTCCRI